MTQPSVFKPNPAAELNWLARYMDLFPYLEGVEQSLLEVGAGPCGLACVTDRPFVGVDIEFWGPPVPTMTAIRYAPGPLPFKAASFHTVLTTDALEHVPADSRASFIGELARVAAHRVVLAFPAGPRALAVDRYMQDVFRKLGMPVPDWLSEHEQRGLPDQAVVEALLSGLSGWRWQLAPSISALPFMMTMLADFIPGGESVVRPGVRAEASALSEWLAQAPTGLPYRLIYVLDRIEPVTPRVDMAQGATVVAALSCPDCAGDLSGETPVCLKCGRAFKRDWAGILHVTPGCAGAAGSMARADFSVPAT